MLSILVIVNFAVTATCVYITSAQKLSISMDNIVEFARSVTDLRYFLD